MWRALFKAQCAPVVVHTRASVLPAGMTPTGRDGRPGSSNPLACTLTPPPPPAEVSPFPAADASRCFSSCSNWWVAAVAAASALRKVFCIKPLINSFAIPSPPTQTTLKPNNTNIGNKVRYYIQLKKAFNRFKQTLTTSDATTTTSFIQAFSTSVVTVRPIEQSFKRRHANVIISICVFISQIMVVVHRYRVYLLSNNGIHQYQQFYQRMLYAMFRPS